MKKIIFLFVSLFSASYNFAQTNDLPQRETFQLNLPVDDDVLYNTEIKAGPYILQENTIQLYPGEKIYVEVELAGKEIKSMKTVKENLHPEKTMIISFSQEVEGKKHTGMMLEIINPFDKKLQYSANIFLMKPNKWVSTSVLPILGKLSSYETWPDVIITIALSGWAFN